MDKRKTKFLAGSLVIVLGVAWLGFSSFDESVAYYKTVGELQAMGDEAYGSRIRVAGNVVPGSILKADEGVRFTLEQEGHSLNIRYVGKDLLPDTFKDDAEAMAEGRLMPGGEFQSTVVQAKCASKYDAAYEETKTAPAAQTPAGRQATDD